MTPPVADRFTKALAAAAASRGNREHRAPLELARHFGIGGYIANHWAEADEVAEYREDIRARRLFERLVLDKASEISETLAAKKIPHFFHRGIVLARWLYEPGERHFVDIDLCITPDARKAAFDALESLGYHALPPHAQAGPVELRPGAILIRGSGSNTLDALNIDMSWGIEPVDRLLPRDDTPVPEAIWSGVGQGGDLPAPSPAHHTALVVQHLVHHDLLHVRSILDLALIAPHLFKVGREFEHAAGALGVLRAARAINSALQRDLGLEQNPQIGPAPADWRGRRLAQLIDLEHWLTWARAAGHQEHRGITPGGFRRRFLMLDRIASARHLLADGIWPPVEFLRWRWPELRSPILARAKHLAVVARKTRTR